MITFLEQCWVQNSFWFAIGLLALQSIFVTGLVMKFRKQMKHQANLMMQTHAMMITTGNHIVDSQKTLTSIDKKLYNGRKRDASMHRTLMSVLREVQKKEKKS